MFTRELFCLFFTYYQVVTSFPEQSFVGKASTIFYNDLFNVDEMVYFFKNISYETTSKTNLVLKLK